jgi:hypothetical protein
MVIIPDSIAMADGLSFTVGQITWTTGVNSFTATATEEAQIRSASTTPSSATALITLATALTTPTTHRPLPRYKGRMINNTDLIEAIDQVGHKLLQNPDFGRFDPKLIYRAGTSSPQQIYPTSSGSPSNTTRYRSSGHCYS